MIHLVEMHVPYETKVISCEMHNVNKEKGERILDKFLKQKEKMHIEHIDLHLTTHIFHSLDFHSCFI